MIDDKEDLIYLPLDKSKVKISYPKKNKIV